MNNNNVKKILPYALAASLFFSGCGEKSECDIPTRHVHKFIKPVSESIFLETYFDDEHLNYAGYNWNEEYIEINKLDEDFYKVLTSNKLFEGVDNWDYLYNKMAGNKDYLKFYYEYWTTETYTETDSKGNTVVKTREVHHDGWTTNPNNSDNTGKTRLYHHKYFGYKIVYSNGRFSLEKSPLVDDIREVIGEYPYFSESCVTEVSQTFKFSRYELRSLTPDDFDVFEHPDLSNRSIELEKPKTKTYENNFR